MKIVYISKGEELRNVTSNTEVRFTNNVIEIPMWWAFTGLRDLIFTGSTAPQGFVYLTRGCFMLHDCSYIQVRDACFWPERPSKVNMKQEQSCNSPKITVSSPDRPSYSISFTRCSVRGNTDEISNGPAVRATWPGAGGVNDPAYPLGYAPAIIGLIYQSCLFGPSLVNYSPGRGNHNFGLAMTYVDDFLVKDCILLGHNRRCPQVKGTGIIDNIDIYDPGTMAVGVHGGSLVDIYGASLYSGPHTTKNFAKLSVPLPLVQIVTGSGFTNSTTAIFLGDCRTVMGKIATGIEIEARDWFTFCNPEEGKVAVQRSQQPLALGYQPSSKILTTAIAGVNDQFDKSSLRQAKKGKLEWVTELPSSKPVV